MTYYLLILSLLIWPFGQLLNYQVPGIAFTFYPLDLAVGLLAISLLSSSKSRENILSHPLFKPLAWFLLVAVFSLLFNLRTSSGGLVYSVFYLARLCLYPTIYFATRQFSGKKIFPLTMISLLIFCLLGLLQYLFFPDMRFLKNLGFDDHYYRLISSFYDPNFAGAIFAGSSLFFLALGQWLSALPLVLLLALTFSRASYLVFLVGISGLLYFRKKWYLLIFLFLLAAIVYFIPKPFGEGVNLFRTFSIFSRFDSWLAGWQLFVQKPLLGWGYNTLRTITGNRFQIDNSYVYLAATTGIFGLAAFFNLLKSIFKITKWLPQRIFILALLTHSLFNNSLFYIWLYFTFWLVSGLPTKGYKGS